jgi:hypothetical protein
MGCGSPGGLIGGPGVGVGIGSGPGGTGRGSTDGVVMILPPWLTSIPTRGRQQLTHTSFAADNPHTGGMLGFSRKTSRRWGQRSQVGPEDAL